MTEETKDLEGSKTNDKWRWLRKQVLSKRFYGIDGDFICTSKNPMGIVAYFDLKSSMGEKVTFSETIAYNQWLKTTPVYILYIIDIEVGHFVIKRYAGGNPKPEPPEVELKNERLVQDWIEYGEWEQQLRTRYEKTKGWKLERPSISKKYAAYVN